MSAPPAATKPCPRCGQSLTVPTADLDAGFTCPRCAAFLRARDLVDRDDAIDPSPAAEPAPFVAFTPPPATPAQRSAPEAVLSAGVVAAGAGYRAATRSTGWLLSVADRVDATLQGHRTALIGAAAAVGVAAQVVGAGGAVSSLAALVFVGVLAASALAGVSRCRDDETGRFSPRVALDRGRAAVSAWPEVLADLVEAPWSIRAQHLGRAMTLVGLVVAETEVLAARFGVGHPKAAWVVAGVWAALLGVIAWAAGAWVERGQGTTLRADDRADAVVSRLPASLSAAGGLAASGHPLVDALLATLSEWRPGALPSERAYHERLFHLLRRRHDAVRVSSEVRVRDPSGGARRVDLVLEGYGDALLVEVKARYSRGDCDRAAQQVRAYADLGLGPVALVLCDAERDKARSNDLLDHISRQHASGLPVFAVVAGARGAPSTLKGYSPPPRRRPTRANLGRVARAAIAAACVVSLPCAYWMASPPRGLLPRSARAAVHRAPRSTSAAGASRATASPRGSARGHRRR